VESSINGEMNGRLMMQEHMTPVERLWSRYGEQVYRFFLRKGFSVDDSLDLKQDTFVRIQRYHSTGIDNELSWVLSIARSIWKNELRYRQASKRSACEVALGGDDDHPSLSIPDTVRIGHRKANDPLRRMLDAEEVEVLWKAIDELSPRIRDCVILRLRDELSYRAIAAILHISEETVKTHMFQARNVLRAKLREAFQTLDRLLETRDE